MLILAESARGSPHRRCVLRDGEELGEVPLTQPVRFRVGEGSVSILLLLDIAKPISLLQTTTGCTRIQLNPS